MSSLDNFKILLWIAGAVLAFGLYIAGPPMVDTLRHGRAMEYRLARRLAQGMLIIAIALAAEVLILIVRVNYRGHVSARADEWLLYMLAIVPAVAGGGLIHIGLGLRKGN